MDILWTKSGFHICFHVQTLSYWTKSGHILDFHVQCMSKSFMIGQGFDRHWTGLDSDWTDLVNFPAFGQTLDGGWTGFGFCVQALSNQPSLRSTHNLAVVQLGGAQAPRMKWPARSRKGTFFPYFLIMHIANCAMRKIGRKRFSSPLHFLHQFQH